MIKQEALGQSTAFLDFQERLSLVAPIERPVLLLGERGTGKELAASRLHYLSRRWQGPFITLNCAALAPGMIESELFGHERGAFTGAMGQKAGRFEAADGGTLFLDEIGMTPLQVQEKILRVVEYGFFERVGSSASIEVDVRIVAATNEDLPLLAEKGSFKRDLLDRLSFEVLFLPPLRARGEDILLLANHFAAKMAFELGHDQAPVFNEAVTRAMLEHPWPGNIRELKNVVERAVYRQSTATISEVVLNPFVSPYAEQQPRPGCENQGQGQDGQQQEESRELSLAAQMSGLELRLIKNALVGARYNQRNAAKALGLSYDQFRGRLRKYQKELSDKSPSE